MATQDKPDRILSVPFNSWSEPRIKRETRQFALDNGLADYEDYFLRGGLLNLDRNALFRQRADGLQLSELERQALEIEYSPSRTDMLFKQSRTLYALVILCSLAAAVQGWDETAVNSAQIYYARALDLSPTSYHYGLVNSAPYLCCTFSCLLTYHVNKILGRRGTIFVTCLISSVACFAQAFIQSWQALFAARFALGFGIGIKSATIPIYSAECSPANVRGALVMMWQVFTAFGIMLGYIAGVALQSVSAGSNYVWTSGAGQNFTICHTCGNTTVVARQPPEHLRNVHCSLNWRLMLLSPMLLPLIVAAYIYVLPESPRWLLRRAVAAAKIENPDQKHLSNVYYIKAFKALRKLRNTKLQAARDLFRIDHELRAEMAIQTQHRPFIELFTKSRNRRALFASLTCMIFQQLCGVNIMPYYSTSILLYAGIKPGKALAASLGFGIINWLFALPAFWSIDAVGRRRLLLLTFPIMAACHALIAVAFLATDTNSHTRIGLVLTGMYCFGIAYSPGEGPVPFVYAAESMPLYNRDFGMGIATSINWLFNWLVAFTWPKLIQHMGSPGTFLLYTALCVLGEITILLLVPETKGLRLEQLGDVFGIRTREHVAFGLKEGAWLLRHYAGIRGRHSKEPKLLQDPDDAHEIPVIKHGFGED